MNFILLNLNLVLFNFHNKIFLYFIYKIINLFKKYYILLKIIIC